MGIQPIGSGMNFDPQAFFKKLDSNNDGGIDKTEFTAALKKKDISDQKINEIFAKIDTNGDGKIDSSENAAALQKMAQKRKPAPPSPPNDASKPSALNTSSSSSSTTQTYDVQDTNKDGVVSIQEKLAYILKLLEENKKSELSKQTYNQLGQTSNQVAGIQTTIKIGA